MFSCKKCGGKKASKQARCSNPCTRFEVQNSDTQNTNIKDETLIPGDKATEDTKIEPCESDKASQNCWTKEQSDLLRKPFDDPIFQIYPGKYINPFSMIFDNH